MDINLDTLSLKELKDLRGRVDRAVASFEDRRRKEALAEIEEVARAKGFSLSELTSLQTPRKRTASTARYANPANHQDTWTGRGRKPRWFTEAIAEGRTPDELAI